VPFHQGKTDFTDRWILPPRKWTTTPTKFAEPNDILMSVRAPVGPVNFAGYRLCIGRGLAAIRAKERVEASYLFHILRSAEDTIVGQSGAAFAAINRKDVEAIPVPLPPLEVQREIVAEIEGYQRIIDGARAVLDNYRPRIPIDPDWPVLPMGEIADFKNGLNFTRSETGETLRIVGVSDFQANWLVPSETLSSVQLDAPVGPDYLLQPGDILFVRSNGNPDLVGRSMLVPDDIGRASFSGFTIRARFDTGRANPRYLAHFFKTPVFADHMKTTGQGANIRNLSQVILADLKVPLPDLEAQEAIVAEIEAEQFLVNGNRELIARFERKIEAAIARVWDEAKNEEAAA
jgi:type I restriction enzyme M protein